jgi:ferredoxin
MALTPNPDLLNDLRRHGAFDVSACFHCGNCTAVCPLSDEGSSFPRRLIRLGQVGDRSRLLEGPDAWLCYYCGECSDTCPREAEPGEYMAALRRYAIAQTEPTGLARLMYRSIAALVIVSLVLAALLGTFLVSVRAPAEARAWLFQLVPYATIHTLGIVVFILSGLTIGAGVAIAFRRMLAGTNWPGVRPALTAAFRTVAEIATMKRHRDETADPNVPWYRNAAWVHLAILYGFMGLLAATILDYLCLVLLPLHLTTFWPARLLGTLSGLVMMYGVAMALWRRVTRAEKSVSSSRPADWWLLVLLLVLGLTGFWLEVAVTLRTAGPVQDIVLLVHAAMAMEVVLLLVFTKMAHIVYRPIALFVHFLRNPLEATA